MKRALQALPLVLAVTLAGCATAGGGNAPALREDLGSTEPALFIRHGTAVLNHHNFQIDNNAQGATRVYLETYWKPRDVYPSERAAGVTDAETRIILQGRERTSAATRSGRALMAELIAYDRVRMGDSGEWVSGTVPDEYKEVLESIAEELKKELDTGVRVF